MNNFIDKLKDENREQLNYITKLEIIQKEFPDITLYNSRWSKHLCSKSVNAIADKVIMRHSCGCCSDACLYAMPYIEREGLHIYSNPPELYIGDQVWYGGDEPHKNWKETLKINHIINPVISEEIDKYFKENPPTDFNEEDECEF